MSNRLVRTLAFVVLIGIVFAASCATFAEVGTGPARVEGTAR